MEEETGQVRPSQGAGVRGQALVSEKNLSGASLLKEPV